MNTKKQSAKKASVYFVRSCVQIPCFGGWMPCAMFCISKQAVSQLLWGHKYFAGAGPWGGSWIGTA